MTTTKPPVCRGYHGEGWLCTLDEGHQGRHEAWTGPAGAPDADLVCAWLNRPVKPVEPIPTTCCEARHAEGWCCTLEAGHDGQHKAYGTGQRELFASWSDPDPTAERIGKLLGPHVWDDLAQEYLDGADDPHGHADYLARYLHREVRWTTDGTGRDHYQLRTVRWHPSAGQPYESLRDLTTAWDRGECNVSTDHCEHPVWTRDTNLRFRVWHDDAHVRHGLGFSTDDELRLFGHQVREIRQDVHHQAAELVDALFCESIYQLAAYVRDGRYPDQQFCRQLGPIGRGVRDLLIRLA